VLGFSFSEAILIGIVALVAVGPQRLPGMLKNFGMWMRKLRKLTTEVRAQTGIDDILRAEGIQGGITELRSLMRGQAPAPVTPYRPYDDPYRAVDVDLSREYPPEGPDAKGALPDDLTSEDEEEDDAPVITVTADHTPAEVPSPETTALADAVPGPADGTSATADAPAVPADGTPADAATAPVDAATAPVGAASAPVGATSAPVDAAPADAGPTPPNAAPTTADVGSPAPPAETAPPSESADTASNAAAPAEKPEAQS
jgi:sec-independent protein translocase protein TatB